VAKAGDAVGAGDGAAGLDPPEPHPTHATSSTARPATGARPDELPIEPLRVTGQSYARTARVADPGRRPDNGRTVAAESSRVPSRSASLSSAVLLIGLALAGSVAAQPPPPPVHLGVIAEEVNEPNRMLNVYGALTALLRERLAPAGIGVGGLVIARDLDDLSQRLVRGEADFVIETVFPTLVLQERSRCLEPSLVVVRRGLREYRSVYFTRKEAPIRDLTDLRGRTLVLQALRSTSAFALPKAELEGIGLAVVPADDTRAGRGNVRYVLAGAEINQAIWVLHGKGDAGAFNEGDWAALPEKVRSQLRVFHEGRPIVRGLLSFRAGLDAGARTKIEETLLGLHEDEAGRAALAAAVGVTRFERLTAGDRAGLRRWAPVLRSIRAR
jgi:phosphonate transport system substrate-binding protein